MSEEVVAERLDGDEALETRVHVAEEGVVVQTHDAVAQVRK